MYVMGIEMIGRASRTQIHDQILFFIWKNVAGNSKFIYQCHITLQTRHIDLVTVHVMGIEIIIWASRAHIQGRITINLVFKKHLRDTNSCLFYNTVRQTSWHFINAVSWVWMISSNMDQCGNVNDWFKCSNEIGTSDQCTDFQWSNFTVPDRFSVTAIAFELLSSTGIPSSSFVSVAFGHLSMVISGINCRNCLHLWKLNQPRWRLCRIKLISCLLLSSLFCQFRRSGGGRGPSVTNDDLLSPFWEFRGAGYQERAPLNAGDF